jgi:hypothetical protein
MVAVRNVTVFFTPPDVVDVKVKDPIKPDVRLSALWIGHATVLIQMDDKVIITDPFLTERQSLQEGLLMQVSILKIYPNATHTYIPFPFRSFAYGSLEYLEEKSKNTALVFPDGLENYLPDYNFKLIKMKNDKGYKKDVLLGKQSCKRN